MKKLFHSLANEVATVNRKALQKSFAEQGHNLTGKALLSIHGTEKYTDNGFTVTMWMVYYGAILDKGILAQNIPFGQRRAAYSLYIQGLRDYVRKRMRIGGKRGLSIAFAIAKTHKKEGLPTRNSRKFSRTGRRKGFVEVAILAAAAKTRQAIIKETNLLLIQIVRE